ncbi:hypothetical protein CMEL01_13275 [Colletotrichum melonis]|uniref:Uncharacterized protein n=1 Tax=Colletotrichum melonis TaxID=1209925 RepID=A0AAI9UR61_9PEZI|nr:hypothetical protein CMEL01_13275 [Colletotrichum melonis]
MSPETAGAQTTTRPCPSLPMIHLVRYVFAPSTPYLGAFLSSYKLPPISRGSYLPLDSTQEGPVLGTFYDP